MSSLFDGVAGLLSDVFGGPVIYRPKGGDERAIQSVFRKAPLEAIDSDGHPVLIVAPTWRVRRDLAPEVTRGDRIVPGDGVIYEIQNTHVSGSPASDAFILCELFEVDP